MENIYNQTISDLECYFEKRNEKKFKAVQVYEWLYSKRVSDFSQMTNLKKELIEQLKQDFTFFPLKLLKREVDVEVEKYLFELEDKERVESVLMRHDYGNSICISTQVGCNMGCKFCESGRLKKVRNLKAYEMVLQILQVEELLKERISHVVLMGIGEPFDNFEEFKRFVEIINHPKSLAIGSRHITVSTSGIIPKIKEFSEFPYQVNLAISLHAPNSKIRDEIMPINKAYPLPLLLEEVKKYIEKTNRRVTFEYILLDGVNDQESHAKELCELLRGINCYVNLIPYNETNNIGYKRSKNEAISKFYDIMKKGKINVTIRREFGRNISAACGQLRSKKEEL